MGAGLAKVFMSLHPLQCRAFNIVSSRMQKNPNFLLPPLIIENDFIKTDILPYDICFFPTKIHWKDKSKLEYIETNLDKLFVKLKEKNKKSIAMPYLGCGLGGLDNKTVYDIIKIKYKTSCWDGILELWEYVDIPF
jgi:hypothetical protein